LIDLKQYLPYQSFCGDLLKKYLKKRGYGKKDISRITPYAMPVFAGRGCPFNCTFCFSTMDKRPLKHSVDYVIRHIKYLEEHYGINHFQFLDENFNFDRQWVVEFCEKIIADGKRYYFTTGNRNRVGFFDREMLELMREANFYDVSIGVESLDDRILQEMNRGTTVKEILDTLRLIKEVGIEQEHIRCLFGFPSDTRETIYNSIKRGNGLGYKTLFALVIPLPGTQLYKYCVQKGLIENEIAYFEELYEGNGYRNMTRFENLNELFKIIYQANAYSQVSYNWQKGNYIGIIKTVLIYFSIYVQKKIGKLLKILRIKKLVKKLVKKILGVK
jgi:radical SAM superfamily enzyme YgiQ (UPF0313 family)